MQEATPNLLGHEVHLDDVLGVAARALHVACHVTSHKSQVTSHQSRVTSHQSQVASQKSQVPHSSAWGVQVYQAQPPRLPINNLGYGV